MTLKAMLIFWERIDLSPSAKLLGIYIGDNSGDGKYAHTTERLCEWIGCDSATLHDAFVELGALGLIEYGMRLVRGEAGYSGSILGYADSIFVPRDPNAYRKKSIHPRLRKQVFERDGYACAYCGIRKDLCVDHVNPEKHGGETALENLVTACRPCNSSKKDRTPEQWAEARARGPRKPPWA